MLLLQRKVPVGKVDKKLLPNLWKTRQTWGELVCGGLMQWYKTASNFFKLLSKAGHN